MNKSAMADILAGLIIACGAVVLLLHTYAMDYTAGATIAFDAGWFPSLLLWLTLAGALVMTAMAALRLIVKERGEAEAIEQIVVARLVIAVGLTLAYVAAFIWLGYWPSTIVFLPLFSWVFGFRNIWVIAGITALFSAATWFVFTKLLYIQIPPWPDA
jgi:hypothetical protein